MLDWLCIRYRRQSLPQLTQQDRNLMLIKAGVSEWVYEAKTDASRLPGKEVAEPAEQHPRVLDDSQGLPALVSPMRSEERRVGKECVSTCRSRWSRSH